MARPNIGSRVTREGHARFWERPEVKFLRATLRLRRLGRGRVNVGSGQYSGSGARAFHTSHPP
jgi:hypothetical protein